jgi:hypothetical protein
VRITAIVIRSHDVDLFAAVAVAAGLLGFGLARIHLPQAVEQGYGDYTRLTAFHLLPLLLAPILGVVLCGSAADLERQAARPLQTTRFTLLLATTAIALIALLPASLTVDVDHAVQVSTENTLCTIGIVAIASGWLDRTWSWFPIVAIGALGFVSSDHSTITTLTIIDRLPGDTLPAFTIWLTGLALYTFRGTYPPTTAHVD